VIRMGITIHYRLGIRNEKSLERVLNEIKEIAESTNLEIRYFKLTEKEKALIINPNEDSETINLVFEKWGDIKSKFEKTKEWDYTYNVMKRHFNDIPSSMWICCWLHKNSVCGRYYTHKGC